MTKQCTICQRNKYDNSVCYGRLQPLVIPELAWSSISIDFIDGLTTILVVVGRLTKYDHFLGLTHPFTVPSVAQLFLDHIFKLHGIIENIITDRGPIFISRF